MIRALRHIGGIVVVLATLTACGEAPPPCRAIAAVPLVRVNWRTGELPGGPDATFHMCIGDYCRSGTSNVHGDRTEAAVVLPEDFDELHPRVTFALSGVEDEPGLKASRTITMRETKEACDRALTARLWLTADGELEEEA